MKKENRIKKNEEFSSIIDLKKTISNKTFRIFYAPKKLEHIRVGLSVSKKLGCAPVRNKIKRQIRMMLIENFNFNEMPNDLIIIVKNDYLVNSYQDNLVLLEKLIKKAII